MNAVTDKILSFALSRGGVVVRYLVGLIIGWVASKHVVPTDALTTIQGGLTSGGMAVLALGYAFFQLWLHGHQTAGAAAIQTALNAQLPDYSQLKVDGRIGNETINAFTDRTGIPVVRAVPVQH